MTIQFNTDKTIKGNQRHRDYFTALIEGQLDRFSTHITRIEVHLSDENGIKEGANDIRCLLEARFRGRQPIVVTEQSDSVEQAMIGAIEKLNASLESILGRMSDHRKKGAKDDEV